MFLLTYIRVFENSESEIDLHGIKYYANPI